jgi:hypothetical protein
MGVLEDAIREHLALKRRHGAADEELRRQEAEALGSARGGGAPAAPEETAASEGAGETRVLESPRGEPAPAEPAGAEAALAEPAPPVEEPTSVEGEGSSDVVDEDTVVHTPPDVEPKGEPGPIPEPQRDPAQQGLEIEIGPEPDIEPEREEDREEGTPTGDLPAVTEDGEPVEEEAPREEPGRKPPADLDFE